ncbi:MAG: diadenylate cyclase CdaA [Oscillospiraceae bacterium]|nr:diadenylate cyclase CdaA [Oscillospiraceae bacterium]
MERILGDLSSALRDTFGNATTVFESLYKPSNIIDILFVAFLIYKVISLIRRSNLKNLAKGLLILMVVYVLSEILDMKMIKILIQKTVELGLIALVILFQPELRRLFERIGGSLSATKENYGTTMEAAIAQTVLASEEMSASRTGALIIFERKIQLNDIMSTGTIINADATAELIKNIFYNKAPLHDGALIIRDGRLASAGCVLPLTRSNNLSKDLGMRHRAGIGLSEQSDAVVIIVSEETGSISVAIEGMLKRHLSASSLEKILRSELIPQDDSTNRNSILSRLSKVFMRKKNEEQTVD